jgi:signal peptidase II
MVKKDIIFFLITIIVFLFDHVSKFIISNTVALGSSIPLIKNFFYISHIQNTGAGFGLFKGQHVLLIWFSVVMIGLIFYYYDKILEKNSTLIFVALILGGIFGNLANRLSLGYVMDFLDFTFWPAFNIADSAISIGAVGLIANVWKKK